MSASKGPQLVHRGREGDAAPRKGRIHRRGGLPTALSNVIALIVLVGLSLGGWFVWAPSAAADVTLVDAVASLRASALSDVDDTGDVPFDSAFSEEVDANQSGTSARGIQDTILRTGGEGGAFLAMIDTSAFIEASATGEFNEADALSRLRVTFEIDAPITILIDGVIGADHSVDDADRCDQAEVVVFVGGSSWEAAAPTDCDGVSESEVVIDEAVTLEAVGTYHIFIDAGVVAEPPEGAVDPSDGSASWNLNFGFCSNQFTEGTDQITGTSGDDILCGGGGNDTIEGGEGSDFILGGAGDDVLKGGGGDDTIFGDDGQDTISGDSGDDSLEGGDGDDIRLYGGPGDDTIDGGPGGDLAVGGAGNDAIDGGPPPDLADVLIGGCGSAPGVNFCSPDPLPAPEEPDRDTIRGQGGVDAISGDGDNDILFGDDGDDIILGGDGDDFIDGGPGNEVGIDIDSGRSAPRIEGGPGDDAIFGGPGDDLIAGDSGNDVIRGEQGSDKLRGNGGNDCLVGDRPRGVHRKDVLVGGGGNDIFLARDGKRDEVRGGPGPDKGRFDQRDDVVSVRNRNYQGGC